ncbi:hypothetical protein [Flavihumibacter sp. CACIAM 22H1]|uniref:hypothetical protein n=1 Tax=Flavihumibacter sp. CACIAM 22H1 TaxID=1812911 RepID=UPI0025C731A8|nr:hypothetical protein [Flavihumibacter sp. CACIAM 22H1]
MAIVPVSAVHAQDSTIRVEDKIITLKEVVVLSNMDVPSFIKRIQLDTSFYRAFKNLHELGYSSLNDVRMLDKKGNVSASLESKTEQQYINGCREMITREEKISGDLKDKKGDWNYTTMEMYAGLFFTTGRVCGENNSVSQAELNLKNKRGLEKHKEQLKMLFFNPGRKIPGIPFIGDKINIYEAPMSALYEFVLDMETYKGENCYVFRIAALPDLSSSQQNDIVINKVETWFNPADMRIMARRYDLSYRAGVYDFDVQMQVEMSNFGALLVPSLIRYTGNWKVAFKKRERGIFTASLFGFHN